MRASIQRKLHSESNRWVQVWIVHCAVRRVDGRPIACEGDGTGIRVALRTQRPKGIEGSTPFPRTMLVCNTMGCDNPKPKFGTVCNSCRNCLQRYKLNTPQREQLLAKQNYQCALCERHIKFDGRGGNGRSACIDHDHITNEVRGILCGNCNTWLGFFESKIHNIDKIKQYLQILA